MAQETPKARSPRVQQLKRSEDRSYTSFKEMGLLSPEQEEFENHDNKGTDPNEDMVEQSGKAEGSGRREAETINVEGVRQRSASMKWVEWLVRPRSSSSPP